MIKKFKIYFYNNFKIVFLVFLIFKKINIKKKRLKLPSNVLLSVRNTRKLFKINTKHAPKKMR